MDAIRYVQSRGLRLYVDGGRLKVYPRQRLTPELRSFIKDHRENLIQRLATPDVDLTVGNILALTPDELEQYRQELAAAPADDPWIGHDRQALRIAMSHQTERSDAA
jgi:hypothetical protein